MRSKGHSRGDRISLVEVSCRVGRAVDGGARHEANKGAGLAMPHKRTRRELEDFVSRDK